MFIPISIMTSAFPWRYNIIIISINIFFFCCCFFFFFSTAAPHFHLSLSLSLSPSLRSPKPLLSPFRQGYTLFRSLSLALSSTSAAFCTRVPSSFASFFVLPATSHWPSQFCLLWRGRALSLPRVGFSLLLFPLRARGVSRVGSPNEALQSCVVYRPSHVACRRGPHPNH